MNKLVIILNTDKPKEMIDKIIKVFFDSSWEHKVKDCAMWIDPKEVIEEIDKDKKPYDDQR